MYDVPVWALLASSLPTALAFMALRVETDKVRHLLTALTFSGVRILSRDVVYRLPDFMGCDMCVLSTLPHGCPCTND